jgi:potassium-transporting ATPase KdpC subunit
LLFFNISTISVDKLVKKETMKTIYISIKIFLVMTILTGIIYPLFITVIGQTIYHRQSNGSMLIVNDKPVGSELIGQKFNSNMYFHSRPSAIDYNPMPSGASNLSVTSKELRGKVKQNMAAFDSINQLQASQVIPPEMIYASGSGLDPHISVKAALLQLNRICMARHLNNESKKQLENLIPQYTQGRQLGFLGEERINVLKLNLELDKKFIVR